MSKINLLNNLFLPIKNYKKKVSLTLTQQKILSDLREDDIVIELGANVGNYTQLFQSFKVSLVAFEPDPKSFRILKLKKIPNCLCLNLAASTKSGKTKLFFHKNSKNISNKTDLSQASSIESGKFNINRNDFVEVQTIDIAKFIQNLGKKIKLLKCDIEGHEFEIIPHLIKTKAIHKIENFFCETHEDKIEDGRKKLNNIIEMIKSNNLLDKFDLNWH